MSDRDELIAKARELSEAVTAGPWRSRTWQQFDPGSDIARDIVGVQSETGHVIAECWSGNADAEAEFIAESRTLLPALADLAESEGRRADTLAQENARLINEVGELDATARELRHRAEVLARGIAAYRTGGYTAAQVWENEEGKAVQ